MGYEKDARGRGNLRRWEEDAKDKLKLLELTNEGR